jgi:hypothetical protein
MSSRWSRKRGEYCQLFSIPAEADRDHHAAAPEAPKRSGVLQWPVGSQSFHWLEKP